MRKSGRRIISFILTAVMIFALMPVIGNPMVVKAEDTPAEHVAHDEQCSAEETDCEYHKGWTAISDAEGLMSLGKDGGSGYLVNDIDISEVFVIQPDKTVNLCLNGHSITQNANEKTDVIQVDGTLNLYDKNDNFGKITHADGKKGRGIISNDTFVMYGGTITGNITNDDGGGVNNIGVYDKDEDRFYPANFTMEGGTIEGNESRDGGGVLNSGNFIMKMGTIKGNNANHFGGGVDNDGTFTMNGGTIEGNNANNFGGGVENDGTFIMNGGTIEGNNANHFGGGVENTLHGTFTMNGGTIERNNASNGCGGGVDNEGTFTMEWGTIERNSAIWGGGVSNDGTFTMTGGTIKNNNKAQKGSGVYSYYSFVKEGGEIDGSIESSAGTMRTVTFNANDGSDITIIQYVLPNENTNLAPNKFTYENDKFDCWNTKSDGNGETYQDKAKIKIDSDLELYTKFFKKEGFDVIFKVNNGSWDDGTKEKTVRLWRYEGEDLALVLRDSDIPLLGNPDTGYKSSGSWDTEPDTINVLTEDKAYTYSFKPIEYTVKYDSNDGEGNMDDQSRKYGDNTALTENIFTFEGRDFKGWNTKKDGSGTSFSDKDTSNITDVEGDTVTLYAQWELKTYTINFVNEDGSPIESIPVEYGKTPSCSETPTKQQNGNIEYIFDGWDPAVESVTGDATYTATYRENEIIYNITFDANGGKTDTASGKTNSEFKLTSLPTPKYEGYVFKGWYTDKTGGTEVSTDTAFDKDTTIYAHWRKADVISYDVTFDVENGAWSDGSNKEKTANYRRYENENKTLVLDSNDIPLLNNPNKGYKSGKWDKEPDTQTALSGNVSYTYTYAPIEYTVKYDSNGGKGSMDDQSRTYDDNTALTANAFTFEGRSFDGWNTKADGTGTFYADWEVNNLTDVDGKEVTLYAQWTVNTYTVTWKNYDGTVIKTDKIAYGTTPEYKGEEPVKAPNDQYSYKFKGWTPSVSEVKGAVTYTAAYTETVNKYTVKFVNEDGTELQSSEVEYDATPAYEGTPIKAQKGNIEYIFAGWSPSIEKVSGEATYTATFSENEIIYNIAFDANGGKADTASGKTNSEFKLNSLPIPEYEGYIFKGWFTATSGGYQLSEDTVYTQDTTIYAQWEKAKVISYDVTFNVENGAWSDGSKDEKIVNYWKYENDNKVLVLNASDIPSLDNPNIGYKAGKWNNEPDTQTALNGNVTYTYTYVPVDYTIKYDANGGEGSMADQSRTYEDNTALTANAFTFEGRTFNGWNTKADGTGKSYADGEVNNLSTEDGEEVTLYAQWTLNTYTVTWKNYDGTVLETDTDVAYGTTPEFKGDEPVRTSNDQYSYAFKGWTPSIASVTGEVTYTATYSDTVNKYTITFVNDDGRVLQSSEYEYGKTPSYNGTPVKSQEGNKEYFFAGWSPAIASVSGNATYKATYSEEEIIYTVTFDANGGNIDTPSGKTNSEFKLSSLPAPTYEGYTFKGWFTESTGGNQLSAETVYTKDTTIFAHWEKIEEPEEPEEPKEPQEPQEPEEPEEPKEPEDEQPKAELPEKDWLDDLRLKLRIADELGEKQTVEYSGDFSLPIEIMNYLVQHPDITFIYHVTYEGVEYTITIPGGKAVAYPEIAWYGPLWLLANYGNGNVPTGAIGNGTYIVKAGDTLSGISVDLGVTIQYLVDMNGIKNPDYIVVGQVIKY